MRTLVIKRSKWARGILNGYSALLNDKGNMCCLGFDARACGFGPKFLKDAGTPEDMDFKNKTRAVEKAPHLLMFSDMDGHVEDTVFVRQAMETNDDVDISESAREQELYELFHHEGIVVEFID